MAEMQKVIDAVRQIVGDDLKETTDDGVMHFESKVSANKGAVTHFVAWRLDVNSMAALHEIDKKIFAAAVVQLRTDERNKHRQGISQGIPKGKFETLLTLVQAGVLASESSINESVVALGYDLGSEKVAKQTETLIEVWQGESI